MEKIKIICKKCGEPVVEINENYLIGFVGGCSCYNIQKNQKPTLKEILEKIKFMKNNPNHGIYSVDKLDALDCLENFINTKESEV